MELEETRKTLEKKGKQLRKDWNRVCCWCWGCQLLNVTSSMVVYFLYIKCNLLIEKQKWTRSTHIYDRYLALVAVCSDDPSARLSSTCYTLVSQLHLYSKKLYSDFSTDGSGESKSLRMKRKKFWRGWMSKFLLCFCLF